MENITEKSSTTRQRKYPLPDFKSIFPYQLNKLHNSAGKSEAIGWCYEFSGLSKETFDKSIKNTSNFAAYVYPFCNKIEKFLNIIKLILYLCIWDDHTDHVDGQCRLDSEEGRRNWGHYFEVMDALQNNVKSVDMKQWKPFSVAIYSIGASICDDLNEAQRGRFIDSWRNFGEATLQEYDLGQDIRKGKKIRMEQLHSIRDAQFAIAQFFIEYGSDLCVSDDEWTDHKIQHLLLLANRTSIYLEDIYSFEKELQAKNGCLGDMSLNLVAFKLIKDNSNIQDLHAVSHAMEWVAEIIRISERQINALCSEMNEDTNYSPSVKELTNHIKHYVGANYFVCTKIDRYNLFNC